MNIQISKLLMIVGILAGFRLDASSISYRFHQSNWHNFQEKLFKEADRELTVSTDQKVLKLYYAIANHMGIPSDEVPLLFTLPPGKSYRGISTAHCNGFYCFALKVVAISSHVYSDGDDLSLIWVLAHELEHHKQNMKHPGSYHGQDSFLLERGADAAAARTFGCYKCLRHIAKLRSKAVNPEGYFCQKDFEPYLQKLKEHNCVCKKHQNQLLAKEEFAFLNNN